MMDIRSDKDFELGFQKIFFPFWNWPGKVDGISFKGHKNALRSKSITELKQKSGVNLSLVSIGTNFLNFVLLEAQNTTRSRARNTDASRAFEVQNTNKIFLSSA